MPSSRLATCLAKRSHESSDPWTKAADRMSDRGCAALACSRRARARAGPPRRQSRGLVRRRAQHRRHCVLTTSSTTLGDESPVRAERDRISKRALVRGSCATWRHDVQPNGRSGRARCGQGLRASPHALPAAARGGRHQPAAPKARRPTWSAGASSSCGASGGGCAFSSTSTASRRWPSSRGWTCAPWWWGLRERRSARARARRAGA